MHSINVDVNWVLQCIINIVAMVKTMLKKYAKLHIKIGDGESACN